MTGNRLIVDWTASDAAVAAMEPGRRDREQPLAAGLIAVAGASPAAMEPGRRDREQVYAGCDHVDLDAPQWSPVDVTGNS